MSVLSILTLWRIWRATAIGSTGTDGLAATGPGLPSFFGLGSPSFSPQKPQGVSRPLGGTADHHHCPSVNTHLLLRGNVTFIICPWKEKVPLQPINTSALEKSS